jgi:serine/threonine protein kinase
MINSLAATVRIGRETTLRTKRGAEVVIGSWRGEGSYARVYRGAYSRTGLPCAVKVAKMEVPEAAPRLQNEEEILAELQHPRIVALLDSGRYGDVPYLVLEWLDGETLLDLVARRRRLPLRQALEILEATCGGILYLHARGVSHGDLRPQNVLIVAGRGAVLTDPGAGPERQPPGVEDVRALGLLLHTMLTGEEPGPAPRLTAAAGYSRGAVQLWEQTHSAQPPPVAALAEQVGRLRRSL